MEYDEKLIKLKQQFLKSLTVQAEDDCIDFRIEVIRCIKSGWLPSCNKQRKAFDACVNARLAALKEENKELLEFKINPDE